MKVLLRQGVEGTGAAGAVVDVREGFARNYLFPRRLAAPLTPAVLGQLEREQAKARRLDGERRAEVDALARRIEGASVTIAVQASNEGKLYGSVGARQIAEALAAEQIPVREEAIELGDPIRALGVATVQVRVGMGVRAPLKVWIVQP